MDNKIGYIFSPELIQACDKVAIVQKRASMVHSLIASYDLHKKMTCISPKQANQHDLRTFHSESYISHLKSADDSTIANAESDLDSDDDDLPEDSAEYGLGFDCPKIKDLQSFVKIIAGGTISAAKLLTSQTYDTVINWCGGWHHAQRDEASGFCYVNDVVLGITELKKKFERVLYIDLDVHHGDGVENAFSFTPTVLTYSVHHLSQGYFPGTGAISSIGCGKGKGFCVNIPLKEGASNGTFVSVFKRTMPRVITNFRPSVVVIQCGADGLAGDPLGAVFNLTDTAYKECLQIVLELKLPTMILGGGGYNKANTARCWTNLTALVTGQKLDVDIPEHDFFEEYGPDFQLRIEAGYRPDKNSKDYIDALVLEVLGNLEEVDVNTTQV
ncbi:histone deacetylase 8-like isoform X1 [Artemia franciscana]